MSFLRLFIKGIDGINEWIGRALSYFLYAFFILLLIEVFLRYLLNSPTVWANELSQMLFGAYVVLSGGYILKVGGHVNVDIIYTRLSDKARAVLDICTSVLFFLFCGMLLVYGGSLAWESLSTLEHSQSAWNPPLYPAKLTIPLAAILLILQGIAKLIKDFLILFGHEDIASTPEPEIGESL